MIVMSKGNYYLENLAYSRYAKISLSIFGQMDRNSIKEHSEIVADVLDKIHHMKSIGKIQMRNSIEEIILTGMLVTKRVYILSRIENQLIKIKHYMKKDKRSKIKVLISIIVPVYNVEKYIADCLESIAKQSYQNIEVIIVNDGSTDNSIQICKDYAEKDKRFKIITQKTRDCQLQEIQV